MTLQENVASHYARRDLAQAIFAALENAGRDLSRLTLEDLAPIDEFHIRGREATLELGRALGLSPGMAVLDVGSGLGGPSRHLATAYGCRVTGIDLTAEYCRVASLLADRLGLADRVAYRQGDALAMPFDDDTFDAAYTQHAAMNIPDKAALYAEVARVLKPGGTFGIYDILQGPGGNVVYPTPWARDPSTSFLATPEGLRGLLEAAGFEILGWRDTSEAGHHWFVAMRERIAKEGAPALGAHILLGPQFADMAKNQLQNLGQGRIVLLEVVCRRR